MLTTLSWDGSRTSYPTRPCCPGARPVPRLASEAAVVEGNAESSHTGTSPWPCCRTPRRNGVCADFCFSRPRPRPSARTTQIRLAAGSPSRFSKPSTPMLAAALPSTSATDRRPYAGAGGSADDAEGVEGMTGAERSWSGPISALVPAAETVGENAHPGTRLGRAASVRDGSRGTGVHCPERAGKKLGVLHGLQPVRFGGDAQDDVLLGDGAAVAVVCLALRVTAAGRAHLEPLAARPRDGQSDFPDRVRGLVVLRLGVHVAQHHRPDLGDGDGLRGNLRHDLLT